MFTSVWCPACRIIFGKTNMTQDGHDETKTKLHIDWARITYRGWWYMTTLTWDLDQWCWHEILTCKNRGMKIENLHDIISRYFVRFSHWVHWVGKSKCSVSTEYLGSKQWQYVWTGTSTSPVLKKITTQRFYCQTLVTSLQKPYKNCTHLCTTTGSTRPKQHEQHFLVSSNPFWFLQRSKTASVIKGSLDEKLRSYGVF